MSEALLRSVRELRHWRIHAVDGEIGRVRDVFFDDDTWVIRYLIADTGGFLMRGREVLLSPLGVERIDGDRRAVCVSLTRQQVENSPDIDLDQPISRQMEEEYFRYYRWPHYWSPPGFMGVAPGAINSYTYPMELRVGPPVPEESEEVGTGGEPAETTPPPSQASQGDVHLRSSREVIGYGIESMDSRFGHVEDLIFDSGNWRIRYLVIDTRNWLPSKSVVVAVDWVNSISWYDRKFRVDLSTEAIKNSPEFSPEMLLDRQYEARLYAHYDKSRYWKSESDSGENRGLTSGDADLKKQAKRAKRFII